MALATRNEVVEEELPANLEFNSPSVGILSQRFPGPDKCQVLDLGAPLESNVAFFSEGNCRVYLEDLNRFFIAPREQRKGSGDEDEDIAAAISGALGFEDSARFDLVLGWDLFSYMERNAIEILMGRIARSCRAGTLLFLTVPTGAMIPRAPAQISMTRLGRLRYCSLADGRTISNPRFSPTALESMMPGFRLLHSFLLGEKMQEFLFSFA
jgi:hypothetical protein